MAGILFSEEKSLTINQLLMADRNYSGNILRQLFLLFFLLFSLLCVSSLFSELCKYFFEEGSAVSVLVSSLSQNIFAFLCSSIIYAGIIYNGKWKEFLGLSTPINVKSAAGVLILFAIGIPALNQVIYYNAQLHFPASMQGLESTLREWENNAQSMTERLLVDAPTGRFILNILIVGVLTGFCEEMFFRGALQNLMVRNNVNCHIAIWSAAFVFSALHFQVFGFLPRLLLGAMFGYLLFWSGSIWLSATAHAINNCIVVVCFKLAEYYPSAADFEMLGVSESGFPVIALVSAVAVVLFIIYFRKIFFKQQRS